MWLCKQDRSLTCLCVRNTLKLGGAVAHARRHVVVCARASRVDQRKAGLAAARFTTRSLRWLPAVPEQAQEHAARHGCGRRCGAARRSNASTGSRVVNRSRCVSAELRARVQAVAHSVEVVAHVSGAQDQPGRWRAGASGGGADTYLSRLIRAGDLRGTTIDEHHRQAGAPAILLEKRRQATRPAGARSTTAVAASPCRPPNERPQARRRPPCVALLQPNLGTASTNVWFSQRRQCLTAAGKQRARWLAVVDGAPLVRASPAPRGWIGAEGVECEHVPRCRQSDAGRRASDAGGPASRRQGTQLLFRRRSETPVRPMRRRPARQSPGPPRHFQQRRRNIAPHYSPNHACGRHSRNFAPKASTFGVSSAMLSHSWP